MAVIEAAAHVAGLNHPQGPRNSFITNLRVKKAGSEPVVLPLKEWVQGNHQGRRKAVVTKAARMRLGAY